jgi:hypothetical protein
LVEDCQRQPVGIVMPGVIRITGIGDHDQTECMIRIPWNG